MWLRLLLPAVIVVNIGVRTFGPVADPDTYWHIATGEWLRSTWQLSGPDPWSDSSSHVWVLHEWLPQLIIGVAHQWGGLAGVAWLHSLATVALVVVVWVACRSRASLLISALVTATAFLSMSASVTPRPHMVTFILTVVNVDAWLRTRTDARPRWWLIPLTWIWACSHGMWFIGIAVGFATLCGMALDRSMSLRSLSRLSLIPAASLIAAAVTPAGPGLLTAPFRVSEYTAFVAEWDAPSLSDWFFVAFLVLVVPVLLIWARRASRATWSDILLTGLACAIALKYSRTVAVGAAIMAPITAATLQASVGMVRERTRRLEWSILTGAAVVSLVVTALMAPSRASHPALGPNGLSAALSDLPRGTVLCNQYEIGGWLILGHPNIRPAIDPRTEVYSVQHVERYVQFISAAPGWRQFIETSGCARALLPKDLPVVEALVSREGWSQTAEADDFVLLERRASAG